MLKAHAAVRHKVIFLDVAVFTGTVLREYRRQMAAVSESLDLALTVVKSPGPAAGDVKALLEFPENGQAVTC
jgi:hypothetical protein